jgi:cytosine/creatinine deaminase
MQDAVLLSGVTLPTGETADVLVRGERIGVVAAAGSLDEPGAQRLELEGYLVLPAPAEPHAHLDKALTATRLDNPTGDLDGAVQVWHAYRSTMEHDDVVRRATTAALTQLANGVTAIRSHIDVGPDLGLRSLEAVVEAREALRGQVDIELVVLPSLPLTGEAGAPNRALLRAAMEAGADVVGGCPYLDPDPSACQQLCLELAEELGRPLDLHTDETLDPSVMNLPHLAELVGARGFRNRVAASHCCSLGVQPVELARRVAAELAAAGIGVISCPQTNLFLQARGHTSMPPRGLTAIRPLLEAGVLLAAGGDNVQDPFNTVGRGDPLEIASLLVSAGHLDPERAYRAVSVSARAVMGLPEVRVEAGFPAELLAIRAGSLLEAVAMASAERVVLHRGRVVARTTLQRELPIRVTAPAAAAVAADPVPATEAPAAVTDPPAGARGGGPPS